MLIEANEKKSFPSSLLPELRRLLISLDLVANAGEKVKRGMRVFRSFASGVKMKMGESNLNWVGSSLNEERRTVATSNPI